MLISRWLPGQATNRLIFLKEDTSGTYLFQEMAHSCFSPNEAEIRPT